MKSVPRTVVQISAAPGQFYALCDDGTVWNWNDEGEWAAWPPVEHIPPRPVTDRPEPLRPSGGRD